MKKAISVLLAALMVLTLAAQPVEEKAGEEKTLTLYAYDTFCGDWVSAATLIPAFEEKTGIKVNVVAPGDAVEVINKVLLEGDNTECDVIFGVTDGSAMTDTLFFSGIAAPGYLTTRMMFGE